MGITSSLSVSHIFYKKKGDSTLARLSVRVDLSQLGEDRLVAGTCEFVSSKYSTGVDTGYLSTLEDGSFS